VLELGPTECRSSEGLGACYSWCLTAPRRSWWSEGSWWALGVCGSLKKRSLYTVWGSPFRRWRKSILSDHLLLGEVRERYPCVGGPTWIRGEHQLLDTTGKNPVVSCPLHLLHNNNNNIAFFPKQVGVGPLHLLQTIKLLCSYSCSCLLVVWLGQFAWQCESLFRTCCC